MTRHSALAFRCKPRPNCLRVLAASGRFFINCNPDYCAASDRNRLPVVLAYWIRLPGRRLPLFARAVNYGVLLPVAMLRYQVPPPVYLCRPASMTSGGESPLQGWPIAIYASFLCG